VRSPDSGNVYTVDLGQNGHMPSCGCVDWHTYHWPCKHFCALFQVTSQTWDDLSSCYRDSPYFSVDDDVLKVSSTGQQSLYAVSDELPVPADSQDTVVVDDGLDESQSAIQRCAASCRDNLRQLVDATYLCTALGPLQDMHRALDDTLANIRQHVPTEAGLALNVAPAKVPKGTKRSTAGTQRFDAIPATKRRRRATRSRRQPAAADEPCTDGDVVIEQPQPQEEQLPAEQHDEQRYFTLRTM